MKISVDANRRSRPESRSLIHDRVTEIYQISQGGGTLLTGGRLVNAKPMTMAAGSSIGPSREGTAIQGGSSRHVGVGDFIVIPAGTPHMFTALDGSIVYTVIRIDPGG